MKQIIKKGEHYNRRKWYWIISLLLGLFNREIWDRGLGLFFGKIFTRVVIFHPNCWYGKTAIPIHGQNKVLGLGAINNHETSHRATYQPVFTEIGKFEIKQYCYVDGKRIDNYVMTVKAKIPYVFIFDKYDGNFKLIMYDINTGHRFYSTIKHGKSTFMPVKQDFYFGGRSTAPHDVTLYTYRMWEYKLLKKLGLLPKL